MTKLLLISSSRVHGTEFLEHCQESVQAHFAEHRKVLFIPYALADHDGYRDLVAGKMNELGIEVISIHDCEDPVDAVQQARGIFIGGGNTFRLLKTLYDLSLIEPLRNAVLQNGIPYMGSSAGTNMACPTIQTTNDMPIVEPPTFNALGLIPFQINTHYLDADPDSTHKGETREQRLTEYLEENSVPVAAIREGSWFEIEGGSCKLAGKTGMLLYQNGQPAQSFEAGDVSFLMNN